MFKLLDLNNSSYYNPIYTLANALQQYTKIRYNDINKGMSLYRYLLSNKDFLWVYNNYAYNNELTYKFIFNKPLHLILDDIVYNNEQTLSIDTSLYLNKLMSDVSVAYNKTALEHVNRVSNSFMFRNDSDKYVDTLHDIITSNSSLQEIYKYVEIPIEVHLSILGSTHTKEHPTSKSDRSNIFINVRTLNILYNEDRVKKFARTRKSKGYINTGYPSTIHNLDLDTELNKSVLNIIRSYKDTNDTANMVCLTYIPAIYKYAIHYNVGYTKEIALYNSDLDERFDRKFIDNLVLSEVREPLNRTNEITRILFSSSVDSNSVAYVLPYLYPIVTYIVNNKDSMHRKWNLKAPFFVGNYLIPDEYTDKRIYNLLYHNNVLTRLLCLG